MRFEPATDHHRHIFLQWNRTSRLEERTCRPLINGTPTSNLSPVITLAFFVENVREPVGRFVYFDKNPRNRSAEFGYMVNPKFRRQGVGYRMLTMAINQLFLTTDLNKLYCQTGAFNTPSIRLLEKLSFHQDGILREHHELDGKLWDDFIYSILRREWKASFPQNYPPNYIEGKDTSIQTDRC